MSSLTHSTPTFARGYPEHTVLNTRKHRKEGHGVKTPEERLNDAIIAVIDLGAELLDLLPRPPEAEPTIAAALREAREARLLLLEARDRVREFAEEVATLAPRDRDG